MDLGRIGIWTFQFDFQPIDRCLAAAREIEELGFGSLWVPEQRGREAISLATLLLSATERIVITNGIARASARDARSMAAAQLTLAEAFPDRYLLGVGGHTRLAGDPVEALDGYLDAMDRAEYAPPPPAAQPPRVLAAINRGGLDLAARRSWGVHTYLCPPRHIQWAREVLGPTPLLAVEQPVVLETRPELARKIARRHLSFYLSLPAYRRMLIRLGFSEAELDGGGADAVVDEVVVWGDEDAVRTRIADHFDAGASHVCLQVLPSEARSLPIEGWRQMAEVAQGFQD